MLILPAPNPLAGELLGDQLAAAGIPSSVAVLGADLQLADLTEAARSAAETVIAAHPATAATEEQLATASVANETTIRQRADQALAANATFLGIPTPTNAQIAAQVKALTRQNNGLIRLVLHRFDGTD